VENLGDFPPRIPYPRGTLNLLMSHGAYVQIFSEFFPIVAFFIAGQLYSFEKAALILIITTAFSLSISLIKIRKIPIMPLFSALTVFIFGGLTVYLDQPGFLIFSDTFYFFALAGIIGIFFWRDKHFLEHIFDMTFAMKKEGWYILSQRWFIVLILAGIGNEIVRLAFTPEVWIQYRFVKILLITGFCFYQFKLSKKYRIPGESNALGLRIHTPTVVL
jgi:intracellular septation protein